MAGPQPAPNQPYGAPQQQAPIPQFAPPIKRQGSTAPKVWGVLLLVLGVVGVMSLLMSIATLMGGGIKASTFSFNMSPEAAAEIDRIVEITISDAKGRWTFWLNSSVEVIIIGISLAAGAFLIIRPKPVGRKLAIARALLVLVALPVYGYESIQAMEASNQQMATIQKIQIDDILAQQERDNPSKTEDERKRREKEMTDVLTGMQPLMRGAGYAAIIFASIFIIAINGLLLFQMTRPAVKDYMEGVAKNEEAIPGYDPSMGLMRGPPPGSGPAPGSQTPAQPPPEQPPNS